ncbi:MAG TPA: NAD(P)/FAD-dependent oxidoreductase [Nocardioides sp.]|uniref:flavin-containing monooxygenase n=1 Tax=Nocardioides sp. TaxID=35761 RepID=UPI002E32D7A4|nr:NAD(P)/FAD-dependent oxidoreductase [Nocardioides sp.]HEX3930013.1 NAD(P)/FAD-dependent oxidoreductase [Nocardioides sp.]
MRVGVIGAGVAGLVTTKVLQQAGHEVLVVDKTPDLGGVWSTTRRYPGLCTQSPKAQYALSDFPMPKAFPQWPSGEQVQAYLADYAEHYDVNPRLSTEVRSVTRREGSWQLELTSVDGSSTETVERLVVANGIFSEPYVPTYDGIGDFEAAGGRLIPGTELHDAEEARDKHVLVVGYGKSACDVTVPISAVAASTDVIARHLLWKVPRKLHGVVNFKMLLMTRMGEALFRYRYLRGVERFLHGPGNGVRRAMLNSVGGVSVRQHHLKELGLVPPGAMEDIVKGAIGLATEGFYEAVRAGTINVRANSVIQRLLEKDGKPHAELSDGTVLPADLVVCSTGFVPGATFLPDEVRAELFDERGNFLLYRQILPPTLDGLYFNGYNSSFFSPLNAEIAALWIAADLGGLVDKPSGLEMRTAADEQLAFMDIAVGGHHNSGGKIIPFSMHNVDEVLGDLNMNIGRVARASHWLNPINPAAYRGLTPKLLARLEATA